MELHPDNIRDNLDQIGKKEGLNLLREWIDSSSDSAIRQKALETYGSIEEGKNFKFFENLYLSDEIHDIRLTAGQILKEKYSNNKKLIPLLEYTLNKVDNVELKLFAVRTLNSLHNAKARKIIIDFLHNLTRKEFKGASNKLREDINKFNPNNSIPESFLDICINLILKDYYVDKCGYHVTLRGGKIYSLNCESSNLNKLSEILGLKSLVDLEHLQLERNKLKSIDGIQILTKLRALDLSYNLLDKIENLESLNQLEELNLSNNKIHTIGNLDSLFSLKKLSLNNNLIGEINNLATLTKLEELNLSHNHISEIKNLDSLQQLNKLNLAYNQIERIIRLKSLKNLMWLYLNNNKISKIEGLLPLENLRGLYLSNNKIEQVETLDNLVNLKKLELSNNKIRTLEGLQNLIELQELYLDNNNIIKVEHLDNLQSLIILHLGRNNISEFRKESIENLHNLNFIFLNENPLDPKALQDYHKRLRFP